MGIAGDDIERVKAAADFVQIVSEQATLRKVGRRWQGLCPFHAEKTPSFSVNAEEKLYYCFGCGAKGDVIRFVEDTQHLDFAGAVEWLAAKYGIQLRYDDEVTNRERQRRQVLLDATARAVEWYHARLLSAPDAGAARAYLRSRGYGREIVERFRLGWAPDDWDALARALRLAPDVLEASGLGFVNRRGRPQDFFRARVLFPIFDVAGRPVAFGGRVLPGGEGPKYKNTAETALYSKSRTLYALNWAKDDVARSDEVIVCEGYTDVIAFFQAGLPRAVATCGTALADEHFRTLKNFTRRIVLAYDADAAGQGAAQRFYEWERKYDVDVVVAGFPAGSDPGDVGREDPEALARAVKSAKPFLEFRLDRVLGRADLRSPEARARAADEALAVVAEHPNELVRDQYLMRVADACRLEPERLRARMAAGGRRGPTKAATATASAVRRADSGPEVEALRLAVHRPAELADRLEAVLFADDVHLAAFEALSASATLAEAIAAARPDAAELLQRLAVEEADADPDDLVRLLVAAAAGRALRSIQASARSSDDPVAFAPIIAWLKLTTEQLWDDATGRDAASHLVAWLVQFGQGGE